MNPPELARRLCIVNAVHKAGLRAPVPCARHLDEAKRYWGLASDPAMKDIFDIIVQFRVDKLGKHK
jgi:hypothetical protein